MYRLYAAHHSSCYRRQKLGESGAPKAWSSINGICAKSSSRAASSATVAGKPKLGSMNCKRPAFCKDFEDVPVAGPACPGSSGAVCSFICFPEREGSDEWPESAGFCARLKPDWLEALLARLVLGSASPFLFGASPMRCAGTSTLGSSGSSENCPSTFPKCAKRFGDDDKLCPSLGPNIIDFSRFSGLASARCVKLGLALIPVRPRWTRKQGAIFSCLELERGGSFRSASKGHAAKGVRAS